jgi:inhibitor of cysteine peptidase
MIAHMTFEGGFYGIVGTDGARLDPTNLPSSFQMDSLRVRYIARVRHDLMSFHMWGDIVDLVWIERTP